jgi:hypothetical protein
MKLFKNRSSLMAVPVVLCAAVAFAGAKEIKKLPRTNAAASVQAAPTTVLPPTIKIDLKNIPRTRLSLEIKSLSPAFYEAWNRVVQSYGYLVARIPQFEEQKRIYLAKCRECQNKTYTQAEMAAAGCLPGDTVADCSQKLFRKCIGPYEMSILDMLVDFECMTTYSKKMQEEFINSIMNKK